MDSRPDNMHIANDDGRHSRLALSGWLAASATMNVPQAAAPVAFSLVSLSLTGETSGGAAIILAMTLAQVVGAIPVTRLGRNLPAATFLKLLVAFRTLALGAIALCTYYQVPFLWLIMFAALAGVVNAAAYGYMRTILNHLTPVSKLPRALGIASTLNEVTFVLAPVLASGLGTISPLFGIVALTVLGALPIVFIPDIAAVKSGETHDAKGKLFSPEIVMWLMCAVAGGATVACIEIGAVALALSFGFEPAMAILFTIPLCLASVAGGVWVSVRNRMATHGVVVAQLAIMVLGSVLAAMEFSITTTIIGAVMIGFVLAPLGTHYALVLDALAPRSRRPELFALLRTANAVGIIIASAVLTVVSLSTALVVVTCLMGAVTLVVGIAPVLRTGKAG